MEAAAKTVKMLSQRILPEKPHHLSFHEDWRYRPPPNEGKRFEEWSNPRLQYLTLLCEADRGVLLTRPDYDMREEPVKPPPREVNDPAKGNLEKKKLSLSDYKNKKTAATSASPPEPSIAKKKESERAPDSRKPDRPNKPREPDPPISVDGKQRQARDVNIDVRLPLKPPTKHPLPPRPPSPNGRKRVAENDEDSRPQKRSKPESGRSGDDRVARDDAQRRKDRGLSHAAPGDAPPHRDAKGSHASSSTLSSSTLPTSTFPTSTLPTSILSHSTLLNGKATIKTATGSIETTSSAGRQRAEPVNGTRPAVTGGARPTLSKQEPTQKSSVPPLLSPLHLSFDDRGDESSALKVEKKRRDEARDKPKSPKPKKPDPPLASSKRSKSPRIPPLLSPTLPPAVEEALQLRKKSLDSLDGKVKEEKESPSKKKKQQQQQHLVNDADEDEPHPKPQRKSLIVTLKLPEGLRSSSSSSSKRTSNIGTASSRKEAAPARDVERPAAGDSAHLPQARKRPITSSDAASETTTLRKPGRSEASTTTNSRLPAPSTPSKKGPTAMSRVSSSNSLAQTPGDTIHATPSASLSAAADRRVNGQSTAAVLGAESAEAKTMRDKEMKLIDLGRRLKHEAELMTNVERRSPGKAREPNLKLGYVLFLESLLAFMAGFHAQNLHRLMGNKKCDPNSWASLFPFVDFLQKEIRRHDTSRRYLPLYSLLLLLHAAAIDELIKCYVGLENLAPAVKLEDLLRLERTRSRIWPQIRETNELIEQANLRLDISPWATLDEITVSSIRILRRWCANEDVDWVPNPSLKEPVVRPKGS